MTQSTTPSDQLRVNLEQRLTESGEKEHLQEILRASLIECGWKDQIKARCRDIIGTRGVANVTVEELMREISPMAHSSIPDEVKVKILTQLKSFVLANVQEPTNGSDIGP
ncbi:Transcription and mRNA export factor eny2 [Dimargaris cristalligena]|uniref:Transcription and mRNA export factor SUS1 n=1 Tax=Dimargaris cristalligena TaxID=215637 RepID=A0A4P9ZT47_9FUNG|nr:Transcription and mRNA export factor eny2 [Dimargaris cristalligena]RKP35902.1 transcription factor e(y)2-domain-containing protein [Dimargaris cristalligena]|eukprot:RKP35902.1 transcription factor e(y)2-domain-containing protein [Dimargaris cristalligena]